VRQAGGASRAQRRAARVPFRRVYAADDEQAARRRRPIASSRVVDVDELAAPRIPRAPYLAVFLRENAGTFSRARDDPGFIVGK
jgi:hypothetical protein